MKLTIPTKVSDIKRQWHLVDLKGEILGRIAVKITNLLMGKTKPYFISFLDCGDYVVCVNAKDVEVTGKKSQNKIYMHYSGFPGGLKKLTFAQLKKDNPQRIIKEAVSGMLPKNKLRQSMLTRLYIYPDDQHPYQARFQKQLSN